MFFYSSGRGQTYPPSDEKQRINLQWPYCFHDITNFEVHDKLPDSDHCSISFTFSVDISASTSAVSENNLHFSIYYKFKWDDSKYEQFVNCLFDEEGSMYLDQFADSIRELKSCDAVSEAFGLYIEQAAKRCLKKVKCHTKPSPQPKNDWYDSELKCCARSSMTPENSTNAERFVRPLLRSAVGMTHGLRSDL